MMMIVVITIIMMMIIMKTPLTMTMTMTMMMVMDHIYIDILKVHRHGIRKTRSPAAIPAEQRQGCTENVK